MGGIRDKAYRRQATPFTSLPWGLSRNAEELDVSSAGLAGDVGLFGLGALAAIRFLRPKYGRITEAYLDLKFKASGNEPSNLTLEIAGGDFVMSGGEPTIVAETTYSAALITQRHAALRGKSDPYTIAPGATLHITKLNVLPQVPVSGADVQRDGFVLVFKFNRATLFDQQTNPTTPQALELIKVNGAALMVP